ncbi:tRNA1(Val) (adenine(37)-N6)-methyltransferase [Fodinisporobacter ferrooxydans]|uniref:tRNA1(Val) (Adenine(37)-N6)-methyltransferase n=1 Tax=Fodinisporobacter ferrooxydans TaxID=2901836 RepID=A0ABY4CN14_9BACL|nr:tRNA1(Val) (adenine(37)-N6)-methyltransferase [Alicyclobacillaceae bacterium MYW30-H2]
MKIMLYEGERIDDLMTAGRRIIQSKEVFSFSMDAVLLARFVTVRRRDTVIDLGTGNGVIPLLLTTRFECLKITAVEIQHRLADMAMRSVQLNDLTDKIQVIEGDLRTMPDQLGHGIFDVVTCNPPYRPVGEGDQNPNHYVAAAKHEIHCNLLEILQSAAKLVRFGGKVAIVHRPDRLTDILSHMRGVGVEPKRMRMVHPKLHARPNMLLVEGIRGGKPDLVIDPPLLVHKENGEYHPEIERIYSGGVAAWQNQMEKI